MTDQEINEAVARKLGWKESCSHCTGVLERHQCETAGKYCGFMKCHLLDYCQDIKAAWEIVEFIYDSGIEIQVQGHNSQNGFVLFIKMKMDFRMQFPTQPPWQSVWLF